MSPELFDLRVLGAVRFVDTATQAQVSDGLVVKSAAGDLRQNRSGLWVIWNAKGLEAHTAAFDAAPATPAIGSIALPITVTDLAGRYLPRAASVFLPRDPDPAKGDQAASLFQAASVALYRTPAGDVSPGWAVIRGHIQDAATDIPLAGVLLRVVRASDSQVLARGMSDGRGEALVVVPGIPVTTFNAGGGSPLATEIDVTIEAIFDKSAGSIPDPDAVESKAGLPKGSLPQKLAAGQELAVTLKVPVA